MGQMVWPAATTTTTTTILEPQGNVSTIDTTEYISRTQGASKPHLRPINKYNSQNYKSTTSYDRHRKSGLQPSPLLLTLFTLHTTATHPAPSPTHYHTPPATKYLITHQTTVELYSNPLPLQAIPFTTSSSSTPTQSLHPPQTPALTPQKHYHTFPRIIIPPQSHTPHPALQYPGWVPANDTKGHNCVWP